MSGQSHPQDDHWFSLVSELGLTPPEPKRDTPSEAQPSGAEPADDRDESTADQSACGQPWAGADESSAPAAECSGTPSFFNESDAETFSKRQEAVAGDRAKEFAAGDESDDDAARHKAPTEPRPMTDWDLLAEELGIAPAKETENTSAAAPTSETAAGDDYVATPQRVHERIEVFERSRSQRSAPSGGAFGDGILDETAAESRPAPGESEGFVRSSRAPTAEYDETADDDSNRPVEDEARPAGGDRKKRKRRRRKAKTSRPDAESRRPEVDDKARAGHEADSLELDDAEPSWIDGDEETGSTATDEPPSERAGRHSRPARDSHGAPRRAPADDHPRPARGRSDRNDDESFDDEGEDDELRPAHKQIPTWEQAVGCIIQANIEARSRRGDSSRGRGRSGGRR